MMATTEKPRYIPDPRHQPILIPNPKLYLIVIDIRNGEREYALYRVTIAKSSDEAMEKAKAYASAYWGEETKLVEGTHYSWESPDGEEIIMIKSVNETTVQEVLGRLTI